MKPKTVWILVGIGIFLLLLFTGVIRQILDAVFGVLAFTVIAALWLIPIGLLIWLAVHMLGAGDRREKLHNETRLKSVTQLIARFGTTPEEQVAGINKVFDERNATLPFDFDYIGTKGANQRIAARYERSLTTMPAREREALRTALLLFVRGQNRNEGNTWREVANLIYGEGKSTLYSGSTYSWPNADTSDIHEGIRWAIGDKTEPMINLIITEMNEALAAHPDDHVLKVLAARMLGNGNDLEAPAVLVPIDPGNPKGQALILGGSQAPDGGLMGYAGEGHLITIAPSRSGKSQCHVIPNLLTWDGPAVVLDVKNELFAATSGWRAANVGPVFKFSPLTPDATHRYNPVTEVAREPDHIWEDSRFLADMLIVPSGGKDQFWDNKARDMVTAAIAYVVYHHEPNERSIDRVLGAINPGGWERFIAGLAAADDVTPMTRAAETLGQMNEQMRDNVRQTALASLSTWEGGRITRATAVSDWRPEDLRNGTNPTVYICLRPNELDTYISMLRVVIAQHIRKLTGELPSRDIKPILFVLDELPRLRTMKPVEEALEIGAQYGLKLWMFAQTMSQMENAYERADGMVGGCAVRCFMNPGMQDGLAQKLSDQLGFRDSVLDGSRQKVVEPTVLAGPEFKDRIIVMASSATPGVLTKRPVFGEPTLEPRSKIPPVAVGKQAAA